MILGQHRTWLRYRKLTRLVISIIGLLSVIESGKNMSDNIDLDSFIAKDRIILIFSSSTHENQSQSTGFIFDFRRNYLNVVTAFFFQETDSTSSSASYFP